MGPLEQPILAGQSPIQWRYRRDFPIGSITTGTVIRTGTPDVADLTASMEKIGLLHPVGVVAPYTLLYGHRRVEAARRIGLVTIPARIWVGADKLPAAQREALEWRARVDKNERRQALKPAERAAAADAYRAAYAAAHPETTVAGAAKEREARGKGTVETVSTVPKAPRWDQAFAAETGQSWRRARQLADVHRIVQAHPDLAGLETEREIVREGRRRARRAENEARAQWTMRDPRRNGAASIRIIHDDNTETIGSGSVDLIVTDPPFGVSHGEDIDLAGRAPVRKQMGAWDRVDMRAQLPKWAVEFNRLLRDGGSAYVFCPDRYFSDARNALEQAGLTIRNACVWHKTNPVLQTRQTRFVQACEFFWFVTKGSGHTFNWAGQDKTHNHFEGPICQGRERFDHPTQKPEWLFRRLVELSSRAGDLVVDPFAGTGTTAKVCKDLGRRCVAVEKDPAYVVMARSRLASGAGLMLPRGGENV